MSVSGNIACSCNIASSVTGFWQLNTSYFVWQVESERTFFGLGLYNGIRQMNEVREAHHSLQSSVVLFALDQMSVVVGKLEWLMLVKW